MYITAHDLVSMRKEPGINVYLHRHDDDFVWPASPFDIPEKSPGKIVKKAEELRPGGNRVRVYLDVITPNDTTPDAVRRYLALFLQGIIAKPAFPAAMQAEQTVIRFGCDQQLEPNCRDYIEELSREILNILERYVSDSQRAVGSESQ